MLKRIVKKVYRLLVKIRYSLNSKIILENKCLIGDKCIFEENIRIGRNTDIAKFSIGRYSYVGENCFFRSAKIGRFTSIAPDVKQIIGIHPSNTFVSTSPVFYSTRPRNTLVNTQKFKEFPEFKEGIYTTVIGNDVWIGAGVRIIDGVTIGDGAIVATGSVVTKDVAPYTIVGGVPAKVIRNRFTEEQIEFLNEFKWWNREEKWIKENAELFSDIDNFMCKMKED